MSAPLVVNTTDGTCWTRREAVRDGQPLYAMADCQRCPELVMATYAELEDHGIAGSADVLPVPAGSVPQPLSAEREREIRSLDLLALMDDRVASVVSGHLAALLDEIDQLREQRERRRVRLVALSNDALSMRGSLSPMGEDRKVPFPLGETLTPAVDWLIARVAELEALTPAAVQTCRKCGAGYSFGEPCQACAFEARMAAEVAARAERPVNRLTETFMPVGSLREEDEFHLHHDYRTGRDLPETGGAQ